MCVLRPWCGAGQPAVASSAAVAAQPVAHPAYGFQRPYAKRPVDLFAEIADVNLYDIGLVFVSDVPCGVQQLAVTENLAGAPHERLKERKLTSGQPNLLISSPDLSRRRVET